MDCQPGTQDSGDSRRKECGSKERSPLTGAHAKTTPPPLFDQESAELLHELNNVFVSVLLNTQVMEWKLPSYSRLKRNLHEVQRNAQRGGELAKRLWNRLEAVSARNLEPADWRTGKCVPVKTNSAGTYEEPTPEMGCDDRMTESIGCTTSVFSATGKKVPHTPV